MARSIVSGNVDAGDYVGVLQRLAALHVELERAWDESDVASLLRSIDRDSFVRSRACRNDLLYWRERGIVSAESAEIAGFRADLSLLLARDPRAFLGAVYVSEGSRMGSIVVGKALARAFGVPGSTGYGLDYHVDGCDRVPARFGALKAELDGLGLDVATLDLVERCALRTMGAFHDAFVAPEVVA